MVRIEVIESYTIIIIIFILGMLVGSWYQIESESTKQPTVKCTDGNLYDVSYEGNITIYEKRPFTTCEERQMIEIFTNGTPQATFNIVVTIFIIRIMWDMPKETK